MTFASFAGVMLLYLLIDTGRLADIPALRLGNALYRLEQVERQVRNLQTSLMGYETEEFPPGSYEVTGTPQDRRHPFRITFALKHSAVPDSVWVFENDAPISPKRFDVEDKRVAVRSPVDPRTQNNDYVIRYFQTPTGFGAGEFGAAPREALRRPVLRRGACRQAPCRRAARAPEAPRRGRISRRWGGGPSWVVRPETRPTARTSICTRRPSSCATAS